MKDLYYPGEHALLCTWFELRCPELFDAIDLFDPPEGAEGIWPERAQYADESMAVANAVARIALAAIQKRRPQIGFVNQGFEVTLGRNYYPKPDRRL